MPTGFILDKFNVLI